MIGGGQAEQLVGRVAHRGHDDDEVVAGGALARDPAGDPLDAVGVGDGRAAELLDDEGGRHRPGHSTVRVPRSRTRRTMATTDPLAQRPEAAPCASISTAARRSRRSPAARSTRCRSMLTAADGNRFAAFRARAAEPTGAGIVILPDVRGLHPYYEELALRFAEHGDRRAGASTTSGGPPGAEPRGDDFEYMPHVAPDDLGRDLRPTSRAAVEEIRAPDGRTGRARVGVHDRASAWAAGCRSWPATLGLDLAGVIGFYGTLAGPLAQRRAGPGRRGRRDRGAASSGCSAAPTRPSRPRRSPPSTTALTAAGVDHRLVTYPGAPHSFFDRKAAEFADASAAAWAEVLAFIAARTG